MKRRTFPTAKQRGNSPYHKHGKKEFDYTPMYRAILTSQPNSEFAEHLRSRRRMEA